MPTVGYEPAASFLFHGFLVYAILSLEFNSDQQNATMIIRPNKKNKCVLGKRSENFR